MKAMGLLLEEYSFASVAPSNDAIRLKLNELEGHDVPIEMQSDTSRDEETRKQFVTDKHGSMLLSSTRMTFREGRLRLELSRGLLRTNVILLHGNSHRLLSAVGNVLKSFGGTLR